MTVSYDIKLGTKPYVLAEEAGLALGTASLEPGTNGELGTVVVGSAHGGIGRAIDDGLGRYKESRGFNTTIPGILIPEPDTVAIGSGTTDLSGANLAVMRPSICFQTGSYGFIVAGRKMYKFDPSATTPALTEVTLDSGSWSTGEEFSGSAFLFNGEMIFGVTKAGVGVGKYGTTASSGADSTFDILSSHGVAFGASSRGKAFWVDDDNQLLWAVQSSGTAFTSALERGPQAINDAPPKITWVTMVGAAVLLFTDGGEVLGADETALWTLAGFVGNGKSDAHFGHQASLWQDVLVIPSQTGLWTFSGQNLLTKAVSGNYIQTTNVNRLRGGCTAAAGVGPYAIYALSTGASTSRLHRLVKYADSQATHDFLAVQNTGHIVSSILPYYDPATESTRLFFLDYNASGTTMRLYYRNLRLPSDRLAPADNTFPDPELDLLKLVGNDASQSMTKLWLQVRGHWEKGSGGVTCKVSFTGVTVDGQTVTIADVTTSGDFAVPIVGSSLQQLGRELTSCTVKVTDPSYDTEIMLPLNFDFVWAPDNNDRITMKIALGGDRMGNLTSSWQDGGRLLRDELLAMEHTLQLLEFLDDANGASPWSVFVEEVQFQTITDTGPNGNSDGLAILQLRRLS